MRCAFFIRLALGGRSKLRRPRALQELTGTVARVGGAIEGLCVRFRPRLMTTPTLHLDVEEAMRCSARDRALALVVEHTV